MDPTSLVLQEFRSCWDSFHRWKTAHNSRIMSSLTRRSDLEDIWSQINEVEQVQEPQPTGPTFTVTEYDSDANSCDTYTIGVETFDVEPTKPHPEYTGCVPTTRNNMIGDDSDYMPFIPYSDDASFNHELHTQHYSYFAWQNFDDPDLEVVCIQTIKQLVGEYGLTIQQIVDTNIMPARITRNISSYLGGCRRDYPEWPPEDPLSALNVPYDPPYINASPSQVLDDLLRYFCFNRNCLHGYCGIHTGELPLPLPVQPTLSNEALYTSVEKSCGGECFILGHHSNSISYWSDEDLDVLHTTLKYAPDTLPCDLAVIVRKPCNEAAVRRRRWLDRQTPIPSTTSKPTSRKANSANKPEFNDFDSDNFTPAYPCSHPGPCTKDSGCPCAKNDSHCIGACKCPPKTCVLKWQGCKCTVTSRSNKTCGTDRCPCFRAHRECDPDLCLKCHARDFKADECKNSAIQQLKHKRGVVYRSQWGLGYYLSEPAREGDLITEYVGDLIFEPTTKSRDPVAGHLNRQYMFKLNSSISVDGTVVGNESRYINHAPGDRANARAHVRLVNGDHRIGIFAAKDIEPGSEVFLDYGPEFFQAHPQSRSPHTDGDASQQDPQVLSLSFYQHKPPTPAHKGKTKSNRNGSRRRSHGRVKLTDLDVTLDQVDDDGSDYRGSGSGSGGTQ